MKFAPIRSTRIAAAVRTLGAGAAAASLAVAPLARAADTTPQERAPRSYAAMMKMKPAELMHLMDASHEGYVTRDEFLKFQQELFERMDKDRDGRISEPEFLEQGG
jgi:hypothetical protein